MATHTSTAFELPDYVGLTFDLYRVLECRPEVKVERAAVFAKPGGVDAALVVVEADVTVRGLTRLVRDAERRGIALEPADLKRAREQFQERGWWRPQDWPGCAGMVTEFRADSAHRESARAAGPIAARELFPFAEAVSDPEQYESAYQDGTRYVETEFAEVFYRAGVNLLGWVSTPFQHKFPRRRVEAIFQHPSILGCPLTDDAAPYGIKERLAVLGATKLVDVLHVYDLDRPGDVG